MKYKSFFFLINSCCSNTSYLIGGGSIAASICSQVGELLLELVVGAVAEAVDHGGGQQHANDTQDGHDSQDQELGRLCLAVLGGDLVDLARLWETDKWLRIYFYFFFFKSEVSGSMCSSIGKVRYNHCQHKSFDSSIMLRVTALVM